MKKVLALVLVAVMLTVMASASTLEVWLNSDVAMSFDTSYVGGAQYNQPDGSAGAYITEHPITLGDATSIAVRGWAGAEAPIDQFGYKLNGGNYVFGDFKQATEDGVINAGGENASRFQIEIPVSGSEPTLITAGYKTTDGTIVDLIIFSVNGEYTATTPGGDVNPPATADAAIVAVVAIACIALAGAVVCKKVRA